MSKKVSLLRMGILAFAVFTAAGAETRGIDSESAELRGELHLAGDRSREIQYFKMESRLVMHGPDGAPLGTDTYRLWLRWAPARAAGMGGDRITCLRFTVQLDTNPEVALPSLRDWSYEYTGSAKGESGRTLGIAHEPFENLVDENGKSLPPGNAYHVYNAFIDFHSLFYLTDRTPTGNGIQDLRRLGQRIVHAASYSTPATNLASVAAEGSFFKNGEITLELKGLGLIGGKECAIIGYDSGASSFTMIMKPAPAIEARTSGSSHYWGDIYKSLKTNWIQRATLHELVVSETVIAAASRRTNGVIERSLEVQNIREGEK